MTTPADVLEFWFGPPGLPDMVAERQKALWWGKNPDTDHVVAMRFGGAVEEALAGGFGEWCRDPRSRLALVLLLDQMPRNIHRGSPRAFAGDTRARGLTGEALERSEQRALAPIERVFLYLPLEHAEDLGLQQRSVALFADLAGEVGPGLEAVFAGFLDYAVAHRDIIERFGRFPHRNAVLGRESTPEEVEFLRQPGSAF